MHYFDDVHKAIRKVAPNPVPGTDGARIIRIIEAAKQSAKDGEKVYFK
jgi:predicted dehydrogenase